MPVTKRKTKKAKNPPLTGKTVTINYRCNGSCKSVPGKPHMGPGDVVKMMAINTNVKIKFTGKSPFRSGAKVIIIKAGGIRTEIVRATKARAKYQLSCASCPAPNIPAEMIVP